MNAKERLQSVFHHAPVDRPPCICPGGMMNMITTELMDHAEVHWPAAHTDPALMAKLALKSYQEGCFENVGVPFCMTVEAEAMGAAVTLGSDIYEPHVCAYAISSVSEWKTLRRLDPNAGRAKVVLDAISLLREQKLDAPIIGNITGPVSTASSLMEPSVFYKELRKRPEDAHAFMQFVTEQLICFARAQLDAGADVIAISDPSGTGEILGPRFFQEYAVKYLNLLLDALQQDKLGTIVHICGQMHNVYPQLALVHCDALSFDAVVSMREAKEKLPGRVLMGNISTFALQSGNPDRVAQLTRYSVKSGADIISPACGLGTQSPLGNIQAILQTLRKDKALRHGV